MDYSAMGGRIRRLRKEKQLTQEQLAEAAEISLSFLGHIERGTRKPSVQTIVLIADALGCSVDEILGRVVSFEHTREEKIERILEAIRILLNRR